MRETSERDTRSPSDSTSWSTRRVETPAHVRLLDDGQQRLFTSTARLEERGEVAALAQLRDAQLELAGTRVPPSRAIAVAPGDAVLGSFSVRRADQVGDLGLHQLLHKPAQRVAHQVGAVRVLQQVPDDLLSRHPLHLG